MKDFRNANYDLMRVMSMIFVVAIHAPQKPLAESALFTSFLYTILFLCNNLFYMLSGKFNLKRRLSGKEDYKQYYFKKMVSILFPYVLMTCLLSAWNMYSSRAGWNLWDYFRQTYIGFISTNASTYLWFMYSLIGMLISAPFLGKMFQSMSDWELKFLFRVAIIWNIVSIYLTEDFNLEFSYNSWIFSGLTTIFLAGYYCDRIINDQNKMKLYIWGGLGFVITVLGKWLFPENYHSPTDLAPAYILFSMAVYTFIGREFVIKNELLKKVIFFLAKHSFAVYMLHWNVLYHITPQIVKTSVRSLHFVETVGVTFVISVGMAFILDMCVVYPIQKRLLKGIK